MDRQTLIDQVKQEYAMLAASETRDTFINSQLTSSDSYYESLLSRVTNEIQNGKFDGFQSGLEIVEAVANNKSKWLSE